MMTSVVVMTLNTGENVVGELVGKPDVTITLNNALKYDISQGYSLFSRYCIMTDASTITFNRDAVVAIMPVTGNKLEYYHLMLQYISSVVDDRFEKILLDGIDRLKEQLEENAEEEPSHGKMEDENPKSPGSMSVDEFFKMPQPKDKKSH